MGDPATKRGRPLEEGREEKVIDMYKDQEYTREMPREQNIVNNREADGQNTYHQKHLSDLLNLRELRHYFLENIPKKGSVSLNSLLCDPSGLVTVDSKDTANACVCHPSKR